MEWTHAPNWIASLGGIRAWKGDAQGNHTYYIYDGGTPLLELDGQGNVSAVNTFGPTGLLSRHSATGNTFYTFDAQGSVAQRLDGSQNVLSSSAYDAHGNKVLTDSSTDPWGYNAQSGYYTDAETGLILCTHRYYDPTQGRWLNRDPIGYSGGINLYGYVGNGVVGGVDPSGLSAAAGAVAANWGWKWLCKAVATEETVGGGPEDWLADGAAVATGVGIGLYIAYQYAFASSPRENDLLPRGQPNSTSCKDDGKGNGQIREYGPDGKAVVDYDFGHDHTGAGDPHAHDWDWCKRPPRQTPRPIMSGE